MAVANSMDAQQAVPDSETLPPPTFETGCEYAVDAYGCDPFVLRDLNTVRELCNRIIIELGLTVVGEPQWHQFPDPGGVTGLYLLSESHLAFHTYPENQFASFNLYCCRRHSEWPWQDTLQHVLGATNVTVRRLERGQDEPGADA